MRRRFTIHKDFTKPININNYLTIEASEDGLTASLSINACRYCVDGDGNWKTLLAGTATESINSGHTLSFKGNLTPIKLYGIGTFTINKKCNLKGNCMSMLFGDNAADNYSLSSKDYAFHNLFGGCRNIVNVNSNFLPATTLAKYCYNDMFSNCTSLTTAPALPATTLADYCYNYMFRGCTSLTTAPKLPATTLANYCYDSMFYGTNVLPDCSNIDFASSTVVASGGLKGLFSGTKVTDNDLERLLPKNDNGRYYLPATTLAKYCYCCMFMNCSNLTTAPELPATTLANSCYYKMFMDCSNLTTAPELPATTLANSCYQQMFYNCTSLTTAPELPATTLADYCYNYMFCDCTKLNYIKMLATNISASMCLDYWVSRVSSTGTFVKNAAMTSLPTGASGIPSGWTVEEYGDFSTEPLTFNILSAGTINWAASTVGIEKTIDYKLNDGEWTSITYNTGSSAPTITVNPGDKLQLRGNNAQYGIDYFTYSSFGGSALFEIEGNIMSLIYGDDFKNKLTISSTYAFYGLFKDCTNLVSAKNLVLPATTLANYCYNNMFYGCTSLTTAPTLPATTLAEDCYGSMFDNCTSLTTIPSLLPATTLANGCYTGMFYGCTSLTTAPTLPATDLADYCYNGMFGNCTKLTTAPELPATTLTDSCYSYMFGGCTSLTTAPELPATTLADWCYQEMFMDCASLNYIKCLATDIFASDCTYSWVSGVASTGTFVKAPSMASWTTDENGIPTGWTVQNA